MNTAKAFIWMVALAVLSSTLWAQTSQGRISGRVFDQSGAVVAGATVTILNAETGIRRALTTNATGEYFAPNLSPGVYSITVEAPSFKKVQRRQFRLEVATDVRQDFELQPGAATETVTVTEEQPLVDTVTDVLGGTLTNKAINELPLQGRDFQNLLELRPGVQRTPGGGFHSVTSNGSRVEDMNYVVDGVDDNDAYYGDTVINGAGVLGTPASHLPLDAIQEFNIGENQGAEYGWKPGAVVNIGLKSGSNQFHGTGYYFHRNSALDARNYFNPRPQKFSPLLLHQFGASVGGPIVKDKLFIFGNYEGVRHKVGNPGNVSSPVMTSIDDTSFSLPDAYAEAGCPEACSPLSLGLLSLFQPNLGNTNPNNPAEINFDFLNHNREDNFIIKSDYHLNERNVITGRYFYGNSLQTEEDTFALNNNFLSQAETRVSVMGVSWTWTPNSPWVNEARFGFNRNWQQLFPVDHNINPTAYGLNTGVSNPNFFGLPRISISPFDYLGGNSSWPLYTTPNHTEQFADNVGYTKGRHNVRFGVEYRHGATDNFRASNGRGRIDFRSLEDFLTGTVRRGRILQGDPHRNVSLKALGLSVQDDWRVAPRITLNLGLRYDLSFPIKEEHNLIANFDPNSEQGLIQVGRGIDAPYDTRYKNFSPRVGLVWDTRGNGKTVLRAGSALIYEQPSIRTFIDGGGLNENPTGLLGTGTIDVFTRFLGSDEINWTPTGTIFPDPTTATCDDENFCDAFGVKRNLATPYVLSWNANIQQAIGPKGVLQIGYLGNHGVKLYSHTDINQYNNATGEYPLNGKFPWLGYGNFLDNLAKSSYNALQVTYTQRAWQGLDVLAGYTYAHAIDNSTSNRSGYPQDSYNFNGELGNGDYDIRHRFTLSLTYQPPAFKAPLQLGSGWTVTSIVNIQGGEPFYFYDSSNDISGTAEFLDRWNFSGNRNDIRWSPRNPIPWFKFDDGDGNFVVGNPACLPYASQDQLQSFGCFVQGSAIITPPESGTFGNMPRNFFRGPGFRNWDMSLTKRWRLREGMDLQLRGEFFNVLNHTNFDVFTMTTDISETTDVFDPSFSNLGTVHFTPDVGVANPVIGSGGSRHIQLGVKLIW